MSDPLALIGASGPASCFLCGRQDCNHTNDATPLFAEEPSMPERTYRVTEGVWWQGRQLYGVGAEIPLDEAVRLNLPGAAEQATGDRKPTQSAENRAVQPSEDR